MWGIFHLAMAVIKSKYPTNKYPVFPDFSQLSLKILNDVICSYFYQIGSNSQLNIKDFETA